MLSISPNPSTTENPGSTEIPSIRDSVPVILLFIFGVFGNLAALLTLCSRSNSHEWRPFYRFVCGLAVTDGGGILISIPISEYQYLSRFKDPLSTPLCDYLAFVYMFTLMSSAMIVCCMSADRFIATYFPLLYNSPTKGRRANITLALLWVSSAILCSLHVFGLGSAKIFYPGSWCFLNFIDTDVPKNEVYTYIYAIVGVLAVIMTIILNFAVIAYFAYKTFRRKSSKSSFQGWREVHVIIFLLTIVTVLTSCWFPLMVNMLQHASKTISGEGETELLLVRLSLTNSVIDPWIYILFRREIALLAVNCTTKVYKRTKRARKPYTESAVCSRTERGTSGSVQANPLGEEQ
ncbi:prostaglandin E2 receptor EP4 subtype-like [Saccostrea echinata]|uniref:prostaglandin E2 receptor EP4 subtype-like n=1 Tax=Saccostrea echinata TaxID=191078 RepID=UPI002A81FCFA|nr:prostaglandin E2 receptor EP4 subtype-like [Saccostrea echinata]